MTTLKADDFKLAMIQLDIRVKFASGVAENDPENAFDEHKFDVTLWSDETDEFELIGRGKAIVIDPSRAETSLWDVLDVTDQMAQYMPLADRDGGYAPEVKKVCEVEWNYPVLLLDRLELLPEARGHGIGLKVLETLCKTVGRGCEIAIMKPFPLQLAVPEPDQRTRETDEEKAERIEWEKRMRYADMSHNEKASLKKLVTAYSKIHFKRVMVDGELFMVRSLL